MNTTLETKRLLLRSLKQSDAIDIFENWASDEDFPKYMTWSAHKNIEETKKIVDMWIKEYEDPKTIRFMIVLKSTNEVIGQIDVVKIVDDIPEIGYLIMKKYWNNGYMSEACNCVINYIFTLGYKNIIIEAMKENIASNKVIMKCDGKYILNGDRLIICQSNATTEDLKKEYPNAEINPLGYWTGGTNVDTGATNRKLGSDMADSVTGGGLHGKDLSKADVSVNIYAFLKAQATGTVVELCCAIGDEYIDNRPYEEIVKIAREFIFDLGGFEKFAEWGLV